MMDTRDEGFMRAALDQARLALDHGDVPIGAVAVKDGQVLAGSHNERELLKDPTAHAEILLLQRVARLESSWRLAEITVYVTIEPCAMCAGALVAARVRRVVYGAPDLRAGAAHSLYNILQDPRLNHSCEVTSGVLQQSSAELLQGFFEDLRTH
ncbi:MAG: tRNA adenosine(34) deaminase TadA [Actinomycetota bacterium]